jgi:hypothetical protein
MEIKMNSGYINYLLIKRGCLKRAASLFLKNLLLKRIICHHFVVL